MAFGSLLVSPGAQWQRDALQVRDSDSLEDPRRFERGPDGALDVLGPEPKRYVLVEESKPTPVMD